MGISIRRSFDRRSAGKPVIWHRQPTQIRTAQTDTAGDVPGAAPSGSLDECENCSRSAYTRFGTNTSPRLPRHPRATCDYILLHGESHSLCVETRPRVSTPPANPCVSTSGGTAACCFHHQLSLPPDVPRRIGQQRGSYPIQLTRLDSDLPSPMPVVLGCAVDPSLTGPRDRKLPSQPERSARDLPPPDLPSPGYRAATVCRPV